MSRKLLSFPIFIVSVLVLTACGTDKKEFDATGTFEATETTVFAEQSGALLTFGVNEGDCIAIATEVGVIDTIQTKLKIQQLSATKKVYLSQKPDTERQIAAIRQQLDKALQDEQRYKELVADGAVPSKMLDDASSQVKVLQKQLDAQISSLSTLHSSLNSQTAAADVQIERELRAGRRSGVFKGADELERDLGRDIVREGIAREVEAELVLVRVERQGLARGGVGVRRDDVGIVSGFLTPAGAGDVGVKSVHGGARKRFREAEVGGVGAARADEQRGACRKQRVSCVFHHL